MKKLVFLVLVFFSFAFFSSVVNAAVKVAVYVEGNATPSQKSIINSAAMEKIVDKNGFAVFERNEDFLSALQAENDFQLSGQVVHSEIRSLAKKMGVDYLIVLNVRLSEDCYCQLSGKIINLVTGQTLRTRNDHRDYQGTKSLVAMANYVTYLLLEN